MDEEIEELYREALNRYLENLHLPFKQDLNYLPYNFSFLKGYKWRPFAEEIIRGDLQEITNIINHWLYQLIQWRAWNGVLEKYDEDDAFYLRKEFLESTIFQCLHSPVALHDKLAHIAINALHQINLSYKKSYTDFIEGDKVSSKIKNFPLSRTKKEKLLVNLINSKLEGGKFINFWKSINKKEYENMTKNYRNLSAHAIAPRIEEGYVNLAIRTRRPKRYLEKQIDDSYLELIDNNQFVTTYAMGGVEPLKSSKIIQYNLQEYKTVRTCYLTYISLLKKEIIHIPLKN